MPTRHNVRRLATVTLAFAVGLVAADRMMTGRSVADDSIATAPTTAPSSAPAVTRPTIPADAQAIFDRVTAAYAQRPIEVAGTFEQHFDVGGIKREQSQAIRGVARTAEQFRHEVADALLVVADGKQGHVYDARLKQFRSAALAQSAARPIVSMQNPALAVAIEGDAVRGLVPDDATDVRRLEPATLDGVTLDGVGYDLEGLNVEIRVAPDGTIERVRTDFAPLLVARGAAEVKRAEAVARYAKSGPADAAAIADDRFAFAPPADARELTAADAAGGGARRAVLDEGPAPAFTLKDLDGSEVKLEAEPGHVVVLDFWATWCPPCRISMPSLASTARKYSDRGVRAYAINREEDLSIVREYWARANLEGVRPLLDADGAVSAAYGVSSIPHTVVIDAKGQIRSVIVGAERDGGSARLEAAIEAALAR